MSQREEYIATCPLETQDVLTEQLTELGVRELKQGYKAVHFFAEKPLAYALHLRLSTASRIFRVVKECAGKHPKMIADQASRINWESFWPKRGSFLVEASLGDKEHEMSSNDISKAVRQGIEKHFQKLSLPVPGVDLKEPDIKVVAFLRKGRLLLSIDTSGKTLHKRGYRHQLHPAPLKETLAAACLRLIGYDGSQLFYDPMCGSGTLGIEACYIALGKAALIHRKKGEFGIERLSDFDSELWKKTQDELREIKKDEPAQPIFVGDIRHEFMEMTQQHALKARVERYLSYRPGDFFELEAPASQGLMLINLPYGERLSRGDEDEHSEFIRKLGRHIKFNYQGWSVAVLAAEASPYKLIGLKPDKKWKILNGSIPCRLLLFNIYSGSRKKD